MKKLLTLIIIFFIPIAVFFLIDTEKYVDNKNEVIFWTLQLSPFDDYMNAVITEFEKTNPNIKIKRIDVPYSEGEKRTLAALLSDSPPDLINLTPDFSALAAQKQALWFIPKESFEQFPESLKSSITYNGNYFAVPFYLTSAVTFINGEIINKAQITEFPATYEQMYELGNVIKQKAGAYTDMPTLTENDTLLKILYKYNINIYTCINNKESAELFDMFKNAYNSGYIPKESLTQNHREALEKFMSGETAFIQAGANFLNIIKENAPKVYDNIIISKQLTGTSGKYDCSLMNLIIPAKSQNKEAALKFALFLTNKENQIQFAKLTSVLPANKYALSDEYFNKTDTKEAQARKISAEQINNLSSDKEYKRGLKNVLTALGNTVQVILTGQYSTQIVLDNLQKQTELFNE